MGRDDSESLLTQHYRGGARTLEMGGGRWAENLESWQITTVEGQYK